MPKFPCPTCKGSGCIKLIAGGIDNDCYLCKGKMRIDVGGPEHKLLLHDKTMDALFKEAFFTKYDEYGFDTEEDADSIDKLIDQAVEQIRAKAHN